MTCWCWCWRCMTMRVVLGHAGVSECSASVESVSGRKRRARERMKLTMMNCDEHVA